MDRPVRKRWLVLIDVVLLGASSLAAWQGLGYYAPSPEYHVIERRGRARESTRRDRLLTSWRVEVAATIVLASLSPALAVAGWRRSRPGRRRRVLLGPGVLACSAATIVSGLYLGAQAIGGMLRGWPMEAGGGMYSGAGGGTMTFDETDLVATAVLTALGRVVAPVVLGALMVSFACRCRRPRGWVEWSSLAVGLGWIVAWVPLVR